MAIPIRPGFPPNTQAAQAPQVARHPAQRAFFDTALGQAPASVASTQTATRPMPTGRIPTNLPAEPPEKILRPGSLLDIRV